MSTVHAERPLVTIICTAYNHGKYISQTLDSFVSQKTNFPFEIIVHDDASTDNTADIIRKYEKDYPHLFRPIYQTENQYQQHISLMFTHILPQSRGTYVALCEGDDYWTDATKLQQQFDYMEAHPDCPLVAHESIRIFENGAYMSRFSSYDFSAPGASLLTPEDVIRHVNDFHTSSLFYRKDYYERNRDFLTGIQSFDYLTKILLATDLPGKTYVLPKTMSAYRVSAEGSWSRRIRDNTAQYLRHIQQSIDTLQKIDRYREYRFHDALQNEILNRQFNMEVLNGNKTVWKNDVYRPLISSMPRKKRFLCWFQLHAPNLFRITQKLYAHTKKFFER